MKNTSKKSIDNAHNYNTTALATQQNHSVPDHLYHKDYGADINDVQTYRFTRPC
jgi:hypothetical protein